MPSKLENLERALRSMSSIYDYDEPYSEVELAGIVALFEVTFELSWKAMKESLQTFGYPAAQTGSPRSVLKTAYAAGMIDDEQVWLDALAMRNNVSHSYNSEIALEMARVAKSRYYALFGNLADVLRAKWTLSD